METVMTKPVVITDMKKKASDILLAISWRELANNYFHKSASWLYHKMDGIDGNGGKGGFTPDEAEQLRGALFEQPNTASSRHHLGLAIVSHLRQQAVRWPTDAQPRRYTLRGFFCFNK